MKFYDEVHIGIQSGKGGDGLVTGRREAGVPYGGPAGGDGGRGGSIFFHADEHMYTLMPLRYKTKWKADAGFPGQGKDRYGADGEDVIIHVPIGTLIKDAHTGSILAHLEEAGTTYLAARGGKGGAGNIHFKNAQNQFPNMALLGEPGQKRDILVELQLLGDVALVGTPSVGKSSLINTVSNVKAKTADYEFTTLVPNLGIVDHKGISFSMVDVPGLIAGASEGKGLGNVFLRHILKARVWVIMLDIAKDIPGIQERGLLLEEVSRYVEKRYDESTEYASPITDLEHRLTPTSATLTYTLTGRIGDKTVTLVQKDIITVVNKYDLIDAELWGEYKQEALKYMCTYVANYTKKQISEKDIDATILVLSTFTKDGVAPFLDRCINIMHTTKDQTQHMLPLSTDNDIGTISCEDITERERDLLYEEGYIDAERKPVPKVWGIQHKQLAYYCFVLPRGNDEAELWFWNTLANEGYIKRLETHGVKKGDVLKIISPYSGTDDRYIMRD